MRLSSLIVTAALTLILGLTYYTDNRAHTQEMSGKAKPAGVQALKFRFACVREDRGKERVIVLDFNQVAKPKVEQRWLRATRQLFKEAQLSGTRQAAPVSLPKELGVSQLFFGRDNKHLIISFWFYGESKGSTKVGPIAVDATTAKAIPPGDWPAEWLQFPEPNYVIDGRRVLLCRVVSEEKGTTEVVIANLFTGEVRPVCDGYLAVCTYRNIQGPATFPGRMTFREEVKGKTVWVELNRSTDDRVRRPESEGFYRYKGELKLSKEFARLFTHHAKSPDGRYIALGAYEAVTTPLLVIYQPGKPGSIQQISAHFQGFIKWNP